MMGFAACENGRDTQKVIVYRDQNIEQQQPFFTLEKVLESERKFEDTHQNFKAFPQNFKVD